MSWISKGLKAVGHGVQHLANQKIAGVSVGSMLGGGLVGGTLAGELARGGDIKQNVIGDARAGAHNAPAVIGGIGALKAVGGAGAPNAGGNPTMTSDGNGGWIPSNGASASPDGTGGGGGWLDTIGGFLKDHGGDIAKLGLGAAAGYEGVKNSRESAALHKDALAKLNAPLNAPDLSAIFADPSNPFAKGRLPVVGRK